MVNIASPAEIGRARALRSEGLELKTIARKLRRHPSVVQRWCMGIKPGVSQAKVEWDPFDKCWRIYVRDIDRELTGRGGTPPKWWALEWLRFENCRVAEEHLERYGEKWGVAPAEARAA